MMSKKWYNCPSCGKRCWVYAFFPQTPCLECLGNGGGGGAGDSAAAAEAERKREREERERRERKERQREREREEREERERLRREREAEEAREREREAARKLEEEERKRKEEEAKKKQYQAATPEFKRWLTQEARMTRYLANFEAAGAADEGFIPDLDDEMLKDVIGIDNPLHRKRLMRVVAAYVLPGSTVSDQEEEFAPYEPPSMPPPPRSYSSLSSSWSVTSSARPVERCAACCHYHVEGRACSMCSDLSGAAAQEEADARPEEHIIFNIASSSKECPKPRQSAKSVHLLWERSKACVGSLELEALVRVIWQEFGDYVAAVDGPCLKGEQRMREKLDAEYNGDHTKLLDLCRLRVRAKRLRTVASIFYALQHHKQLQGLEVVYVKNRFADPSATGHRDMALVLHHRQLDVLVELQLAWEALAKGQKASHVTYERIREKEAEVELDKRKLAEQQQRLFNDQDTVFSPRRRNKGRA